MLSFFMTPILSSLNRKIFNAFSSRGTVRPIFATMTESCQTKIPRHGTADITAFAFSNRQV
jgi:hypothetical protein